MQNEIHWPAILIIDNDDFLYYLESEAALLSELQQHFLTTDDCCKLLDSSGQQHSLNTASLTHLTIKPAGELKLNVFNQLVRNHLSACQQCCVLKITITSYQQGIELIKNTLDN